MDTPDDPVQDALRRLACALPEADDCEGRRRCGRPRGGRGMTKTTLPVYVRPYRVPELFGVSRSTLYRWAAEGHITIHRRGAMAFVRVADLHRVIEGRPENA